MIFNNNLNVELGAWGIPISSDRNVEKIFLRFETFGFMNFLEYLPWGWEMSSFVP